MRNFHDNPTLKLGLLVPQRWERIGTTLEQQGGFGIVRKRPLKRPSNRLQEAEEVWEGEGNRMGIYEQMTLS